MGQLLCVEQCMRLVVWGGQIIPMAVKLLLHALHSMVGKISLVFYPISVESACSCLTGYWVLVHWSAHQGIPSGITI